MASNAIWSVLCESNINALAVGTPAELGTTVWTIVYIAFIASPCVLVKTMKKFAWLSAFSVITIVLVVPVVVVMCAIDRRLVKSPPFFLLIYYKAICPIL